MSRDPLQHEIRHAPPENTTDRTLRDGVNGDVEPPLADVTREAEPSPPESPLALFVEYL